VNPTLMNAPRGSNLFKKIQRGIAETFLFADRQYVKTEQHAQTLTEVMRAFA
jgi:hypothetical protein